MRAVILGFVALALHTGAHAQFMNCAWVHDRDCSGYKDQPQECGTDFVTYDNICTFAKAHCNNNDLHIANHGACHAATTTVNPGEQGVTHGQQAILDFFCASLSHRDCDLVKEEICGTDGFTYFNTCEYDKERCTHRNLHVDHFGPCTS